MKTYDLDIPECRTADGVVVKRGDVVWRVFSWGMPRRNVVDRDMLKVWKWWRLEQETYASERLAFEARLAAVQKQMDKAKREAKTATRTIGRLREALDQLSRET